MIGSPIGGFVDVGVGVEVSAEDGVGVEDIVTMKVGLTTVRVAVITIWVDVSVGFGDGCSEGVNEIFSTRQAERVRLNNTRKQRHLIMA